MRREAALIVGGGPAGTAAAITLARAGTRALLLERDREPADALCGGFLSWRTLQTLSELGIDALQLGGAPVSRLRLFAGRHAAEAPLPAGGIGLSRRTLDEALQERARAAGAVVQAGVRVGSVTDGVAATSVGEIAAESLFLATGKHELRGLARPRGAAGADPALGLRVRLADTPRLRRSIAGTIELHLFDRGYAGLVMQERTANLCLAVRRSRLDEAGGSPARLIRDIAREVPSLAARLDAAGAELGPIDAVAQVPYGWRQRSGTSGLFRLGDQAGVIPSLAGEGIGIALASGILAAREHHGGGARAAGRFQRDLGRRLARPIGLADAIRALAEHPAGAAALVMAARLLPAAIAPLARWTRVSGH